MNCPKCKASNPAGAKFCEKCGAKLKEKEAATGGTISKGTGIKLPKIPAIPQKFILPIIGLILLIGAGIFGYRQLTNNPKAVIANFFKAMGKNDLTTALALVMPEERLAAKAGLDSFLSSVERLEIKKVIVKNVVISDEEASADVELDFDMKLKSGQKFSYSASKGVMVVYDGKTKVEVPISESNKYSQAQSLLKNVELEKVKGKWYLTNPM